MSLPTDTRKTVIKTCPLVSTENECKTLILSKERVDDVIDLKKQIANLMIEEDKKKEDEAMDEDRRTTDITRDASNSNNETSSLI